MEILRTPDERFVGLPGYHFAQHYAQLDDFDGGTLRIHYLDEGPADGDVVVLLHGEPSWSFLYRKMIPVLSAAGHRVIAPDLVGFGRSDKPTKLTDYTYQRHIDWIYNLLFVELDLHDVTLFCQDWGGLIGLRIVAEHPERFARVVAANTAFPTGDLGQRPGFFEFWRRIFQERDQRMIGLLFFQTFNAQWLDWTLNDPEFNIGELARQLFTESTLSDEIVAGYNAPYPDNSYKAGARAFPQLIPMTPDDPAVPANRAAWQALQQFDKPFLTTFSNENPSESDLIGINFDVVFQHAIPGAKGQPHVRIERAGHFLQEDKGEEIATVVNAFIKSTSGY